MDDETVASSAVAPPADPPTVASSAVAPPADPPTVASSAVAPPADPPTVASSAVAPPMEFDTVQLERLSDSKGASTCLALLGRARWDGVGTDMAGDLVLVQQWLSKKVDG